MAVHHEVLAAGALEARLRKLSDVLQIISTHKGSFVFIIHPT